MGGAICWLDDCWRDGRALLRSGGQRRHFVQSRRGPPNGLTRRPRCQLFSDGARSGISALMPLSTFDWSVSIAAETLGRLRNELKVTENGIDYLFGLRSRLIGGRLNLSPDGAGGSKVQSFRRAPSCSLAPIRPDETSLENGGTTAGTRKSPSGRVCRRDFQEYLSGPAPIGSEMLFGGKDANGAVLMWTPARRPGSELSVAGAPSAASLRAGS